MRLDRAKMVVWTPLKDREKTFADDIDPKDPWQFKNFRFS